MVLSIDMKIVRINKGKSLPLIARIIGLLIVGFSITRTFQLVEEPLSILLAIGISIVLPALWFATNLIVIDHERKTLFDGIWTMGFKIGKNTHYKEIQSLSLEKIKTPKRVYSLPNNKNIVTDHEYRATIELNDGKKYYLFSHPLEKRANEKLIKIRNKLGIDSV